MWKNLLPFFAIVFVVLLATFPLLHKGFPPTHDGEYHVIRFYEFYRTLSSGVVYPRWAMDLNNNYGVPLFNYVYPLPNYIASFMYFFGVSFIDAFKYNFILATFVSAVGFFYFVKKFTSPLPALVGTILYVFTPYRFVDTYVRGSVGEIWSLAIFPWLLWSLFILLREKQYYYILTSSVLVALLVFSHNILAILFLPFLLSYLIFLISYSHEKLRQFLVAVTVMILGTGISAIFWLPALFEKKYVRGLEVYDYKTNFPDFYSLIFPSWGTGLAGDVVNGMSTQIGVVNILIVCLSLFLIPLLIKKRQHIYIFILFWILVTIFLMLHISIILWDYVPLFHFVQFPWRYLSMTTFLIPIVGSLCIFCVKRKMLLSVIFITSAFITTFQYTKPAYYHYRNDMHYVSRDNFIHGTNSPGNSFNTIWIDSIPATQNEKFKIVSGKGNISVIKSTPELYVVRVNAMKDVTVRVGIAYFPGWTAGIAGKEVSLIRTKDGAMSFFLNKGKHFVEIRFVDTMIRRIGALITVGAMLSAGAASLFLLSRQRKNENCS
ncbi:MAG: hypothetical protein RLZZ455_402 [Candidatus Parcubacteria bacterium]|jgi:uncharacterized membrane protein